MTRPGPKPPLAFTIGGGRSVDAPQESERPKAPPISDTSCPPDLLMDARRHWEDVVPKLAMLGTITDLERDVLRRYCWLLGQIDACQRKVNSDGATIETLNSRGCAVEAVHPACHVIKTFQTEARAIEAQLGIGASNRASLKLPKEAKEGGGLDKVRRGRKPRREAAG